MTYLISTLFIIEFLLILIIFLYLLFKKGFTFKGGIAFGVLYFIFIPIWVMIFTGKIAIGKASFSQTHLSDVILNNNIGASFALIIYLFFIIVYLYLIRPLKIKKLREFSFKLNLKLYLNVYLASLLIIFIGSGLLKGGNWYDNRDVFFKDYGSIAVLIAYILAASRILVIASLIYLWNLNKLSFRRFLVYIIPFIVLDMFLTGNRIYLFTTFVIIGLFIIKKHPIKSFILFPISIPFIALLAYFGSIFRHMRGPLFMYGFPTPTVFITSLKRAIHIEPFSFSTFFLNISESVNVNVIYDIFNHYDKVLYGTTYLKTFFFYVPRSIWISKPESITTITAKYFGSVSLVTTIIGEMQMNFSYFGIVLLPLLLWLTESIIVRFSNNNIFYGIIAFFFGVLIFRMPYSDEVIVFLLLILMLYLSRKRFKLSIKI